MRRVYLISAAILIMLACGTGTACARAYTSTELINEANTLDGSKVKYSGEIIAVIMNRGDHSWINLNDGSNAIGIWCETGSLKDVKTLGGYKHEGDVLDVTGIFHRACPQHGGELDIHADSVGISRFGFQLKERISARRINVAIAFFIMTLLALFMLKNRI